MGTETADRKAVVAIMLNQSMTVPIIEHSTPPKLQAIPKSVTDSVSATKVEYKQVGRSGLWVSNPILGTLGIGDRRWMDWLLEEEDGSRLLVAAYARGINTWDTANAYSNGMSEEIIGRTIKKHSIPRQKLVLMTKVGRIVADPDGSQAGDFVAFLGEHVRQSRDYVNQSGLSRSAIFTAVEQSLKRLQTSYIDVLHVHRYDNTVAPEETMKALHDLVTSDKVRYIAASSMWAHELAMLQFVAEKNGWTKFVAMQNHYSLLYREEEREVIKFCNKTGMGILPWSPLAEGHLARPRKMYGHSERSAADVKDSRFRHGRSEADKIIIDRVQEIAGSSGWTMSQVALAWLNKRVTAPIVGINSVERMEEVLGARGKRLSVEQEAYLEEPYKPKPIQGHL